VNAVIFNAAGLTDWHFIQQMPTNLSNVATFSVQGDPVSAVGYQLGANKYVIANPESSLNLENYIGYAGYLYYSHSGGGAETVINALNIAWTSGAFHQSSTGGD
jgi:hypothetical protein